MTNDYKGSERRRSNQITNDDIERIAKRAKDLALEEVYADIGKGVVKRLLWILGIGGTGLAVYLSSKGYIK